MATLHEIYNLYRTGTTLKARMSAAIAKAAQNVLSEPPGTSNHANRVTWARNALVNAEPVANTMFWGLLGDSNIQTNGDASTDAQIQSVVDDLIDSFATGE